MDTTRAEKIKRVRDELGVGLIEARQIVRKDEFEREMFAVEESGAHAVARLARALRTYLLAND